MAKVLREKQNEKSTLHFPLSRSCPFALPPSLPFHPGPAPYLVQASCARRLLVALRQARPPTAMELPQSESVAGSALSPAGMRGGAQRPGHLPGLRLGAHGLLGSPERAAASSPVTNLTQTMHHLAGLGR